MKRPRRPVKRKVASKKTKPVKRKTSKIVRSLKQALKYVRGQLVLEEWTAEDAAVFDIPQPPSGFAYQWSPVSSIFRMQLKGWSQVPFSRHPEIGIPQNFDGYVVYRGMALFQISADLVKEALAAVRENSLALGQLGDKRMSGDYSAGFGSIMPEEWVIDEPLPDAEPLAETELTIKFTMPTSWPGGAAACHLDLAEYVRRRLVQEGHLLCSDNDGVYSIVRLTTEKVV